MLRHLIERLRFIFLFIMLILFCLSKAIDAQFQLRGFADILLFVLIIIGLSVIGNKKIIVWFSIIAGLEIIFIIWGIWEASTLVSVGKALFAMCYFILMSAESLKYTLADKNIDLTTLFGALTTYMFIGLVYAYLYLFLYILDPSSFSGFNNHSESHLIYYSFVTLTTLGLGDVFPLTPLAETFTWFESFTGQAYLTLLIGQLVGRYVACSLKNKQI